MDDSGLMERMDSKDEFSGIKEGRIGVECTVSHQISEKIASGAEILYVL